MWSLCSRKEVMSSTPHLRPGTGDEAVVPVE